MDFEIFAKTVQAEPKLFKSLNRAATGIRPAQTETRSFSPDPVSTVAGLGALVILFPVVQRIVTRIGLPWVKTLENFSELWRNQVEQWIDAKYQQHGFNPDQTRAASEALLKELQTTTGKETRGAWQRLLEVLSQQDES